MVDLVEDFSRKECHLISMSSQKQSKMETTLHEEHQENTRGKEPEKLYTSDANGAVKLRESYGATVEPVTMPVALEEIVEKYPDKPALRYRLGKEWETITYREYYCMMRMAAKGFIKLELERSHSVCILGMNSPEWFVSNFAAIMAGGFSVGIYPTSSPEACLHNLNSSRANIVIVEDDEQLQKILKVKDQVPTLKFIIQYTGNPTDSSVLTWSELLDIGVKMPDDILEKRIEDLSPNQCCSILFTSGTTGLPKAAMISHDNILFNAKQSLKYLQLEFGKETVLSHLPMSHIVAQLQDLYLAFLSAACVYLPDKNVLRSTLIENLKAARPTFVMTVPRMWEKINEYLETRVSTNGSRFKHKLLNRARKVALTHYTAISEGHYESEFLYKVYRNLVYNWIRESVGLNRCKHCVSGGAPIPKNVRQNLMSLDICLGVVYGLTECGIQVLSVGNDIRDDCYGKVLQGTQVKIDKPNENGEGEIRVNGRHIFMGYLNNAEKTEEMFDEDGWLCTGDFGILDSQSFIKITGRIKSELNPLTGTPSDKLRSTAQEWCKSVGYPCKTVSEIVLKKPAPIYDAIKQGIDKVNSQVSSRAQKIQKFTILPRDFSPATGELSSTMKLSRGVVYKKYEDEINKMYSQAE